MEIVNLRLMSHPMNWVIVLLMLVIAGMFGHLLLSYVEQEPSTATDKLPAGMTTEQLEPELTGFQMSSLTM